MSEWIFEIDGVIWRRSAGEDGPIEYLDAEYLNALESRVAAAESDLANAIRREVVRDMEIEELYAELRALKGRSRDD